MVSRTWIFLVPILGQLGYSVDQRVLDSFNLLLRLHGCSLPSASHNGLIRKSLQTIKVAGSASSSLGRAPGKVRLNLSCVALATTRPAVRFQGLGETTHDRAIDAGVTDEDVSHYYSHRVSLADISIGWKSFIGKAADGIQ